MNNKRISANLKNQVVYEMETWHRSLNYLRQENVHLKIRLAEIVRNELDKGMLEYAEHFQNHFLNKDVIISIFKQDLVKAKKALSGESLTSETIPRHDNLRNDMNKMEVEFSKIKFEFNSFLAHSL